MLLRLAGRRTSGSVVIGLFWISFVAGMLINVAITGGDAILAQIAPDFW